MFIELDQVEMKPVVNKATNEQLSVVSQPNRGMIEIKRTRAPKEKMKNSQNSKEAKLDNK